MRMVPVDAVGVNDEAVALVLRVAAFSGGELSDDLWREILGFAQRAAVDAIATDLVVSEAFAARLFLTAISEGRAGELLECLFEGGSATLQGGSGALVLFPAEDLMLFVEPGVADVPLGPDGSEILGESR